jgi:hypothetical protein
MKTYQFSILSILILLTLACGFGEFPSFAPTPTSTPIPSPTITPEPPKIGQWEGVADGWDPPLTISFNTAFEDGNYHINNVMILIPDIDTPNITSTIECSIIVENLEVKNKAFSFSQDNLNVFDAKFINATTVNGSIYGGWLCQNSKVDFGGGGSYLVAWHAEWKGP